ncbi:MAG: restriction endonuclease subunit S [Bacteroidetes bacterium]|nr:restriction endonuclease subunit S [Bacteroidota bacterium]
MNNWEIIKLGEIEDCDLIMGQSPLSESYNYTQDGLPFLQGKAEFKYIYPLPVKYTTEPIKIAEKNDILISVRAPVGDVNIAPYKLCIGRGLAAIRFQKDVSKFYFYWFQFKKNFIGNLGMGSTFKAITIDQLKKLDLPIPTQPEQKAIAEILTAVDDAIQKSDEAINRTERLKREMMNKLFSQGIGHKNIIETKIGKIPSVWEIKLAKDICLKVTDGTHDSPKPQSEGKLLFTSKNIKKGKLVKESAYLISEDDYVKANSRSKVDTFDILFSMIGTIGETAIVLDSPVKFAIKNVGLFKLNGNTNLSNWFYYYLNSQLAMKYIKSNVKGTTQNYITLESLKNFPIAIPPENEMNKISEILGTIDNKLKNEYNRKQKSITIKKSLMNDLLTGKKRIKTN